MPDLGWRRQLFQTPSLREGVPGGRAGHDGKINQDLQPVAVCGSCRGGAPGPVQYRGGKNTAAVEKPKGSATTKGSTRVATRRVCTELVVAKSPAFRSHMVALKVCGWPLASRSGWQGVVFGWQSGAGSGTVLTTASVAKPFPSVVMA